MFEYKKLLNVVKDVAVFYPDPEALHGEELRLLGGRRPTLSKKIYRIL